MYYSNYPDDCPNWDVDAAEGNLYHDFDRMEDSDNPDDEYNYQDYGDF